RPGRAGSHPVQRCGSPHLVADNLAVVSLRCLDGSRDSDGRPVDFLRRDRPVKNRGATLGLSNPWLCGSPMTPSLLLLTGLFIAAEPEKPTLPVRVVSLATDPAHVRPDGQRLYISGFHASKLSAVNLDGKIPTRELLLDAYETYRMGENGQEHRTINRAAGGDVALARGKIFI